MSGINERTKRQIALLAGDDLEGVPAEEAQRSVDSCPNCRGHWTRVRGCLDVLERVGKQAEPASGSSLWPVIEAQLCRPVVRAPERFNGWVPALSMAAACIALLIAGQMDARPPQDAVDESWVTTSRPMVRLAPSPSGDLDFRMVRDPAGQAMVPWSSLGGTRNPATEYVRQFWAPYDSRSAR